MSGPLPRVGIRVRWAGEQHDAAARGERVAVLAVEEDLGALEDGSLSAWFEQPLGTGSSGENEFEGFMDVSAVDLPHDAQYYLCGPLPFMQAVRSSLIARGVPAKDIQYEVFGPDLWLADFQ